MSRLIELAAAASACAMLAGPALAEEAQTKGEKKLAKILEGRVAGEPENCIRTFPSGSLTIIDGTALVYKRGKTLWVNVPRNPKALDDSDGLLTRTFGTRLCNTDIVTTFDRGAGFYTGNVFLGDFVPYTKAS